MVGIYVGLPILAPILMNAGLETPGRVIYTLYRPMCHQMASRSFFIGGEQIAYPRPLAGAEGLTPIDAYIPDIPEFENYSGDPTDLGTFLGPARAFLGNEQMGYKMALCERDIAIYGFVLVGGLLFWGLHRRIDIKPLSIWAFMMIGLGPIGLDGFTQLFAYMFAVDVPGTVGEVFNTLHQAFPLRESPPLLRTFTGALFGLMLAWLAYPRIAEGMEETRQTLEEKLGRIGELP